MVGNGDAYSFFFGKQFRSDGDFRVLRAVFQCIDQQITQNDFTFVLIETHYFDAWIEPVMNLYILCFPFADEILRYMFDPFVERVRLYEQFAFSHFHLAHIEHHVDQILHSLRLPVNRFQRQVLGICRG